MAALVAGMKKKHHLQEQTIMRIVDMNFALAQSASAPSFGGDEDFPFDVEGGQTETEAEEAEGQLLMFPEIEENPEKED